MIAVGSIYTCDFNALILATAHMVHFCLPVRRFIDFSFDAFSFCVAVCSGSKIINCYENNLGWLFLVWFVSQMLLYVKLRYVSVYWTLSSVACSFLAILKTFLFLNELLTMLQSSWWSRSYARWFEFLIV